MKSLDVAYHVARMNRKKMAHGGECYAKGGEVMNEDLDPRREQMHKAVAQGVLKKMAGKADHFAQGGEVEDEHEFNGFEGSDEFLTEDMDHMHPEVVGEGEEHPEMDMEKRRAKMVAMAVAKARMRM